MGFTHKTELQSEINLTDMYLTEVFLLIRLSTSSEPRFRGKYSACSPPHVSSLQLSYFTNKAFT